MTLNELKSKYNRLSQEIDTLAVSGEGQQARLLRLMNELDQVHAELNALRRRTLSAPTLRDAVSWGQSASDLPQAA
jgi:chromosome condensin MukBEF complex kleisin-like MukF subunit